MYPVEEQDLSSGDDTSQNVLPSDFSLEDVEVTVVCQVAEIKMSLAKLSQLKVGDSLELTTWPNTVRLLVNSRPVAEGVLVEISGMLAVKITRKL